MMQPKPSSEVAQWHHESCVDMWTDNNQSATVTDWRRHIQCKCHALSSQTFIDIFTTIHFPFVFASFTPTAPFIVSSIFHSLMSNSFPINGVMGGGRWWSVLGDTKCIRWHRNAFVVFIAACQSRVLGLSLFSISKHVSVHFPPFATHITTTDVYIYIRPQTTHYSVCSHSTRRDAWCAVSAFTLYLYSRNIARDI